MWNILSPLRRKKILQGNGMIYDIAKLRVQLDNRYEYTARFCREYLSADQDLPADITATVSKEEFEQEKSQSAQFSDGYIENICLYRSLCLQLPRFQRMLLHASILEFNGNAYAFLGRSGTGKSTHTRLWMQTIENCRIINGDKPILEETENGFIAHGTPWRGKENWGEKRSAPLKGFCFIEQAKENAIERLTPSETSMRLFQQILLPTEAQESVATLEMLDRLIAKTPAYLLKCDISEKAVETSFTALTGLSYEQNRQKK